MAFESFFAGKRPERRWRSWSAGYLLSMALHLGPAIAVALSAARAPQAPNARLVHPVVSAGRQRDAVEKGQEGAKRPPPPPKRDKKREESPSKTRDTMMALAPETRTESRSALEVSPPPPPAPRLAGRDEGNDLDGEAARSAAPEAALATAPNVGDGPLIPGVSEGAAPAGLGVLHAATTIAAQHPRRLPAPAAPYVPTSFAQGLRVHEDFPSLPSSLSRRGARYVAAVEICVSTKGSVSGVNFRQRSAPDLDRALYESIRTWRYRPWLRDGVAAPFCHPLRITYTRE
jgi:hypothetical protein